MNPPDQHTSDLEAFIEAERGLRFLQQRIHETAVSKGWWEPLQGQPHLKSLLNSSRLSEEEKRELLALGVRPKGTGIALMHSELSEALENVRAGCPPDDKIPQYTGEEAELADVIIRILDHAAQENLDVIGAMFTKAAFNKTRPHMHGGKAF